MLQVRRITYVFDVPLALLLSTTLSLFSLFLILPLSFLLLRPLAGLSPEPFLDMLRYPYLSIPPLGEWYLISDRGEYKLLRLLGMNFGVILNSIYIASAVTVLATLIGILVATVMARYEFPGKTLLRIASIMPLLYTPFVGAFVLYKIFGDGGMIGSLMLSLGLPISLEFAGIAGVIIAQTIMFWPIVYLNTMASMLQIDPTLEEQAENMGSRGLTLYRTITLPLSMPGIAAGAGLVFIFSMEDLAAPLAFKVRDVMSVRIVENILASGNIEELGTEVVIVAGLLLLMALSWFFAVRQYVSLKQYAMLSRGGRWKPRVFKPGPLVSALIYLLVFPLVLFSALPQVGVFLYAFSENWRGALPQGFTLDHFVAVLSDDNVVRGLRNSVLYSLAALVLIVTIGATSSYVVSRLNLRGVSALDALVMSPLAIPGLSIAMGLLVLYGVLFKDTPLDPYVNPAFLLVISYAIRKSPFTTRSVFAGLQQVHKALEEAAMNLGASRTRTLFTVVLPLIGLNLIAGSLISFVYSMSEVSTSITIGSLNREQAPLTYYIYDYLTSGYGGGAFVHLASAIVALMIIVQLVAITVSNYVLKYRYAFLGI
ncbi:MAG: iron ABC transporter permease [Acidilobaceae archaeon]